MNETPMAVTFTEREKAELAAAPPLPPLGPNDVRGTTVCSLVSPGTEIGGGYLGSSFPLVMGYASVFTVTEVGAEVSGIEPGRLLFAMGKHCSLQQHDARQTVPIPYGLPPERAVLCRLMGVSMTTLMTTAARPGDLVMVTGAGPVGFLAAQVFRLSGYRVCVVEPDPARRKMVERSGIRDVVPEVPTDDPERCGRVRLVVECSGHEQAVMQAIGIVGKGAEIVLVGVPWRRRTDLSAHEFLYEIFHNYVVVRSGWEWELPHHAADFRPHSIFGNFATALDWLAAGRIDVESLTEVISPRDAQNAYHAHLHHTNEHLFTVFAWNGI